MQATENLTQDIQDLAEATGPAARAVGEDIRRSVRALVDQSAELLRESGAKARDAYGRAAERTAGYVQERPVQAMLIAAAAGALVAVLAGMATRRRGRVD